MLLSDILNAAGVSLDSTDPNTGSPYRYSGLVILCYIEYKTKDSNEIKVRVLYIWIFLTIPILTRGFHNLS